MTKELTVQVTGMTCAACATRIEKVLNRMDGVKSANVNLAIEKAAVQYDETVLKPLEIEKKYRLLVMML